MLVRQAMNVWACCHTFGIDNFEKGTFRILNNKAKTCSKVGGKKVLGMSYISVFKDITENFS